jgi:membrane associated rhomboid family serine protease
VKLPALQSLSGEDRVHTIGQEIKGVLAFLGSIWAVFLLDLFLPLEALGLVPRQLTGLVGIVAMPWLHANVGHLLSNSLPLLILLTLLAGSRAGSLGVVVLILSQGGLLLWLFGRSAIHIGASLLVFGLVSFLLASGLWFERRPMPVVIALVVAFLYGIPLILGVLPWFSGQNVSWDGHLFGAVAGVLVAGQLTRNRAAGSTR